jgi:fructose-1-phosphate kinase PfkB-like protein
LGGHTGAYIEARALAEGLNGVWTRLPQRAVDAGPRESRTCVLLARPGAGDATVINGNGPPVDADDWARLRDDALAQADAHQVIALSGSLPPGAPLSTFTDFLRALVARFAAVWVDTSGPALTAALAIPGLNIKVNRAELSAALGVPLSSEHLAEQLGALRATYGLNRLVLTLGAEGAAQATARGVSRATPPPIALKSSVGSGDALLAGMLSALAQHDDDGQALRLGVAVGAANAASIGGGCFDRGLLDELLMKTAVLS